MKKFWIIILILLPLSVAHATWEKERSLFVRAENALKKNDQTNYQLLSQSLKEYPLYPYLLYEELRQKIKKSSDLATLEIAIVDFEKQYSDFPKKNNLRNEWLLQVAQQKNWGLFVKGYQSSDKIPLQCLYHYAQFQETNDLLYLKSGKFLWMVGFDQPMECHLLFNELQEQKLITKKWILDKYLLALKHKNFELAAKLKKQLPSLENNYVHLWEETLKKPILLTENSHIEKFRAQSHFHASFLAHAISLLAKQNAEKAAAFWNVHEKHFHFSDRERIQIQRDIGVYLSHQKSPMAMDWLSKIPATRLDKIAQDWKIRISLANHDWPMVIQLINDLSPKQQKEPIWIYWKAKAFDALGKKEAAHTLFKEVSHSRSYYGFMASNLLHIPYSMEHKPYTLTKELMEKINKIPAMARFFEFHKLKRTSPARVEWFNALNTMDEKTLIAAAYLAQELKMPDVAIFTMAKCDFKDDIELRFPLLFQDEMLKLGNQYKIDPAWAFAIARQESAFFSDAISGAGARGLMQLLPSTADMIAKKYALHYPCYQALHDPHVHMPIAIAYLNYLLAKTKGNILLATASYNAGPRRANEWLPKDPMPADVWIETIPYLETREYVKNVITFMNIYHHRLNQPFSLAAVMVPINK